MAQSPWLGVICFGFAFLINPVAGQEPKAGKTPPRKQYAQEYHQPFKGKIENAWDVVVPGADQDVRFEAGGLRITLPPGRDGGHKATGVTTKFGVQGDFEITLSFEILKEADAGTNRTVLDLVITKDVPKADVTTIGRLMSPKDGTRFIGWANMWDSAKEKMTPHSISVPTNVMTGRLRLVRSGVDVYYGFSDGFERDFRYFKKFSFGAEDIRRIRIVGSTDGDQATLDVRVTDFRIRADAIPNLPAGVAVAQGAEPVAVPPAPPRNSLILALVFGLGITVLALTAGTFLYLRGRKQILNAAPASTIVTIVCAACGKELKVKAELAGKKIKCSQCGSVMSVS